MVPTSDARLVPYVNNFYARGNAAPGDFSFVAAQMTQLGTLRTAYIGLMADIAAGNRSKALVADKNAARKDLLVYLRELYSLCQASLTVTPGNKELIGVVVRKTEPTPKPAPGLAPVMAVKRVDQNLATYTLRDASTQSSRRRPINAVGALVLSYVGETPPASKDVGWKTEGQTGKTQLVIEFPIETGPTVKCWATAMWVGTRGEFSPACDPVQVYLHVPPVAETA